MLIKLLNSKVIWWLTTVPLHLQPLNTSTDFLRFCVVDFFFFFTVIIEDNSYYYIGLIVLFILKVSCFQRRGQVRMDLAYVTIINLK